MVSLFVTVAIVALGICAASAGLVGLMQAASTMWERTGARDLVRGAEAMLRAAAPNTA